MPIVSMFAFFSMERELSEILGRDTPQFLSPYFRSRVVAEAETLYDHS